MHYLIIQQVFLGSYQFCQLTRILQSSGIALDFTFLNSIVKQLLGILEGLTLEVASCLASEISRRVAAYGVSSVD